MPESDRALAERLHSIVTKAAPTPLYPSSTTGSRATRGMAQSCASSGAARWI